LTPLLYAIYCEPGIVGDIRVSTVLKNVDEVVARIATGKGDSLVRCQAKTRDEL